MHQTRAWLECNLSYEPLNLPVYVFKRVCHQWRVAESVDGVEIHHRSRDSRVTDL